MLSRGNRKLEKRMKELMIQAEDERRHADQYKEQVRARMRVWWCKGVTRP